MGTFNILNNISAVAGQRMINIDNFNRALNRQAPDARVKPGADDDNVGFRTADGLRAAAAAQDQAIRSVNDGIGFLQTAAVTLGEIADMLTRMATLAEKAANESIGEEGSYALNDEFHNIRAEIARLAGQADFNGIKLFGVNEESNDLESFTGVKMGNIAAWTDNRSIADGDGPKNSFFTRDEADVLRQLQETYLVAPNPPAPPEVNLGGNSLNPQAGNLWDVNLSERGNAAAALTNIEAYLTGISNMRGDIDAGMNRMHASVAEMQTQARGALSVESQIRDANAAKEITNLTKSRILAQTDVAALSHTGDNRLTSLSLLQ